MHPTVVHRGRRLAAAEHWRACGRSRRTQPIADARPSARAVRYVLADGHAAPEPDRAGVQRTGTHRPARATNAHGQARATNPYHLQSRAAKPHPHPYPRPDANLHAESAARGEPDANAAAPARRDPDTALRPVC